MGMDPVTGAIAGAVISGGMGLMGGSSTNSANAEMSRDNNETSINLANTAVQRRANDMRTAGVNPMLAAGSAADTPSMTPYKNENFMGEGARSAVDTMTAITNAHNTSEQTNSNVNLNSALSAKAASETATNIVNLPVKKLKAAGATALEPLMNSAVGTMRDAFTNLDASLDASLKSSAKQNVKIPNALPKLLSVRERLRDPTSNTSVYPPLTDVNPDGSIRSRPAIPLYSQ